MDEKVNRLITLASGRGCKYMGWNGAGRARIARTLLSAPESNGGLEDHRRSPRLRETDGEWVFDIPHFGGFHFDRMCAKAYNLEAL